ncbi:MAG: DUF2283 domain-containing protein [candidate division KSB1 bacterium]|nr:DUF2283 domain-containing protein [candidate division KSB1 bacterium]
MVQPRSFGGKNTPVKDRNVDWDYDEEADVFYISFGKPVEAVGIDMGKGIILRYSEKLAEVGETIYGMMMRSTIPSTN